MRHVLGVLEALLALAFIATAVVQLLRGKFGATDLASSLILIALGAWLAKMALGNFRSKPTPAK
jgi:hypothetical protein